MENVTEKNTKAEILKAYDALLKNVQQEKADVPKQFQEEKQRKEKQEQVADLTNDGIVGTISELRKSLNSSFEELQQKLLDEFKKLEDIRSVIAIEKQSLEDIYSLNVTTDSLAAMLLVHKEKKDNFEKEMAETTSRREQEMAETKSRWEQEKAKQINEEKEYIDELTKRRKREEEEYQYTLKITRQKENDQYEATKDALEKALTTKKKEFEQSVANREEALKKAEDELAELRKNNSEFPARLEKAVTDKEDEITKTLNSQHAFEIKFLKQQNESEIRLKDQTIVSLQEKIKELQAQVKEYGEKANRAEEGVKDIAVKAIENAAKTKMIERIESSKD